VGDPASSRARPGRSGTRAPEPEVAPFADDEGRFVKRKKRIRKFPHVLQIDEMDCGAASLAIVCRYYARR
jgi:ATP-binding cassette subfamily B protein